MSNRSVQFKKVLRQCGGDKARAAATRPNKKVLGTGKWLGKGYGVGEVVTLPRKGGN